MRLLAFSSRNAKEMLRDRLNLCFGIGFPLVLLFLLSLIQKNVPVDLFSIEKLAPGVAVFGFSFIALFSGTLIAHDRGSSLMLRLLSSPLRAREFILGYALPLVPMAAAQAAVCFAAALLLGLPFSWRILLTIAVSLPAALFFIAIGLLCGSVFTDKQVGGVCGALLTNVSAWLSGTWFDVALLGGGFRKFAYALPFVHAVNAGRAALSGSFGGIFPDLWWVIGWAAAAFFAAVMVFRRKMRED